ncbi:hypothetical protein [Demequina pelophila]|uniref:hypothetical protein n=1 Tax=Demequina pelophila TaxID=1638984 RepID=UPI00078328DF|nr:hypothetical protein [Demequina pelophila]
MSAAPLRQQRPYVRGAARTAAAEAERPRLAPVQAPEQARSFMPFVWLCLAIVVGALASVLIINTTMAQGAYERRDLKIEIAGLHKQGAAAMEALEASASPTNLARRAQSLGMAPAGVLGFVSLSDGIVLESGEK